jgi:hypothetical protein
VPGRFPIALKTFCGGRIVAASLQHSDHLSLIGDVPFSVMEKAFSLLKKLFQGGVTPRSLPANIDARAVF